MNRSIFRTTQIVLVVFLAVYGAIAQRTPVAADRYKISAKAGMINYSEGLTSVTRANGTTGTLIIGDQLNAGDKVLTSTGGTAEVLLNPGSYIRLGEGSEFNFRTTSLDDLRLEIHRGSAILEVFASSDFRVSAFTPKGRVTIVNTGVYRIDVAADGTGLLSVIDGKAVVGDRNIAVIKEGQTGTVNGGVVAIGKFDKGKRDSLASWSRSRSKELAKMASAFNAKNTRPLILDSLISSYTSGIWGRSRTAGVWIYDAISRTCLFMPFWSDWTTPYGYGYNACACNYYFPPYIQPILPIRPYKPVTIYSDTSGGAGKDRGIRSSDFPSGGFDSGSSKQVVLSPPPPVSTAPVERIKP